MKNNRTPLRAPSSYIYIYKEGALAFFFSVFFLACQGPGTPDPPQNTRNYTVNFDANGGTGGPTSLTVNPGIILTEPTSSPSRTASGTVDNYYFGGWYTTGTELQQDGTTKYKFGSTLNSDLNLYARWYTSQPANRTALQTRLNSATANTDLNLIDVRQVSDMNALIANLTDGSTFNYDISRWDTSAVTNMNSMFAGASTFNQDIGSWDTFAVLNMGFMFLNASAFNQNLTGWVQNPAGVSVSNMFDRATAMQTSNKASWMP